MYNKKEASRRYYLKHKEEVLKKNNLRLKKDFGLFSRFEDIKKRCNCKTNKNYKWYGARGIKCEWLSYEDFRKDMYLSFIKHLKKYGRINTTIDRINNNGNYSKENCQWATQKEQANNKRPKKGTTLNGINQQDASILLGGCKSLIAVRIKLGWNKKKAFTQPILKSRSIKTSR